jgi:hypothetical protein
VTKRMMATAARTLTPVVAMLALEAIAARAAMQLIPVPSTVMSFTYGSSQEQIDTTLADPNDPFRLVIQNYRVEADGTVWLLSGRPGTQTLRHFHSKAGLARLVERISLPIGHGAYTDFVFIPGGIVLSRQLMDPKDIAVFYRFERGRGIVSSVTLPRGAGYNLFRGRQLANLGRMRIVSDTLYNCFDRNGSCVRIGAGKLFPQVDRSDVMAGAPTATGSPLWMSGSMIFHGIMPIVDLSGDPEPAVIQEVFEDGSFVVKRVTASGRGIFTKLFEMYNAEGKLLRSCELPEGRIGGPGVGDGDGLFFSIPWIYRLNFGTYGVDLERY